MDSAGRSVGAAARSEWGSDIGVHEEAGSSRGQRRPLAIIFVAQADPYKVCDGPTRPYVRRRPRTPSAPVLVPAAAPVIVLEYRAQIVAREHVGVDHPAQQRLVELAPDRVALGLRRDGALRTEERHSVPTL